MSTMKQRLISLGACREAIDWIGDRTLAQAWAECERGDWLLWYAAQSGVDILQVVRAACECARPALVHVPAGEDRPLLAIETALRWCDGQAAADECDAAGSAARAASSAAWAAGSAAWAAGSAAWAAGAAGAAGYAARAAGSAAWAAGASEVADIIRGIIPAPE